MHSNYQRVSRILGKLDRLLENVKSERSINTIMEASEEIESLAVRLDEAEAELERLRKWGFAEFER